MKRLIILFITTIVMISCTENDVIRSNQNENQVAFTVKTADSWDLGETTRSSKQESEPVLLDMVDGMPLYLHTIVEPRNMEDTRGTLINSFKRTDVFGVSGYRHGVTDDWKTFPPNFYHQAKAVVDGDYWITKEPFYWVDNNSQRVSFCAYYPYNHADVSVVSSATQAGPVVLSYTVNSDMTKQQELLTATAPDRVFNPYITGAVPLQFKHDLTAVTFVAGDDIAAGYLKEVKLKNILTTATDTIGVGWSDTGIVGDFTINLTASGSQGLEVPTEEGKDTLNAGNKTLLMIPQKFTNDGQYIQVRIDNGTEHNPYCVLNGTKWEPGTKVTYIVNTSKLNCLNLGTVVHPTTWGGIDFTFRTAYEAGDAVGVFAVDNETEKVAYSNRKYVYNGTSWEAVDTVKFRRNYTYYIYYPYRKNVSGARAVGSSASPTLSEHEFFQSLVANWSVSADQSTLDKLLANDLHVAKGSKSGIANFTYTMKHGMGLTQITMDSQKTTQTVHFYAGNSAGVESTLANQTIWIYASSKFVGNLPYTNGRLYYFITKPNENRQFNCVTGEYNSWNNVSDMVGSVNAGDKLCELTATMPVQPNNAYTFVGWEYGCIENLDQLTATVPGSYKFEVWGAQGGNATQTGTTNGGTGGYGAGNLFARTNQGFYICVGGKGGNNNTTLKNVDGGYNGGGNGRYYYASGNGYTIWGGGGGATHIATGTTNRGLLMDYNTHKEEVLVVGGAGGGASNDKMGRYAGGKGGGSAGTRGSGRQSNGYGTAGTQTASGRQYGYSNGYGGFGYGGGYSAAMGSGGGAGWYGGGGGNYCTGSAGGGSGYIGGVMNGEWSQGVRSGAGLARIISPVTE